ncbi:MAG: hypothetical protein H6862_03040 [Rhodospirillales bacterium]|nr:hypothetical protein [Rhodospirillales bacterium]
MMFNGFEQILMYVIRNSGHSDETLSDEKRFDNAMKALFGDYYTDRHIDPPSDYSYDEMLEIQRRKKNGMPLLKAIRLVTGREFKRMKAHQDSESNGKALHRAHIEKVKKHLLRFKNHYDNYIPADSNQDIEANTYMSENEMSQALRKREDIFQALYKAGW